MRTRGAAMLRIHPAAMDCWLPAAIHGDEHPLRKALLHLAASEDDPSAARHDALASLAAAEELPDWLRRTARALTRGEPRRTVYPNGLGEVLIATQRVPVTTTAEPVDDFTGEDDASCFTRRTSLREHSEGVRAWALRFTRACGVPAAVAGDLALSAWLHDIGKADPRFQIMLHGGDEVAAACAEEPLAKSGMSSTNRGALRRARERSDYP